VTAIIRQRCDPYGVEIDRYAQRLAGGLYSENHAGNIHWHCEEPATGRYRMICTGGNYGHRPPNDGGQLIAAYHCEGGHKGQAMNLCTLHVREFTASTYTTPRPLKTPWLDGAGNEQWWAPGTVLGGSRATDTCTGPCLRPPEAQVLMEAADRLQAQMSAIMARPVSNLGLMTELAANARDFEVLKQRQDTARARMDELYQTGRVHKCPLTLREVS
jgi:hypothetical protein